MTTDSYYPVMEIRCGTCSRNRYPPVCLGGGSYCNLHEKRTNGSWLEGQPRPDEPCMDYNPDKRSLVAAILRWRQEKKETQ